MTPTRQRTEIPAPEPALAIKAIELSLRCYSYSWGSLIPLAGLPLAFMAFTNYREARAVLKGQWNPAGNYLAWGSLLSSLGLLVSLVALMLVICAILKVLPGQYQAQ